jgi:hypothetical protein
MTEGIIYRYRAGIPWRDLPSHFGSWQTVWKHHRRNSASGTCDQDHGNTHVRRFRSYLYSPRPGRRSGIEQWGDIPNEDLLTAFTAVNAHLVRSDEPVAVDRVRVGPGNLWSEITFPAT